MKTSLLAVLFGLTLAWARPLSQVDQRALTAPPSAEQSLEKLASYLCPPEYSQADKARSIFRWVADRITYDLDGLRQNKLGKQTPEEVLQRRQAVCEGYARLYQALAEQARLDVALITGESSFNNVLGIKLPPGIKGHAWNAVLIQGRWQLVDPTWAAGAITDGRFHKNFNDYWYCTPPQQFVYTHLPKQERWQLLEPPFSAARFSRLPHLTSEFFRLGLSVGETPDQPLEAGGEKVLRWRAPEDVVNISQLFDSDGRSVADASFSQSPKGWMEARFRCPQPGNYRLRLLCRKRGLAWEGDVKNPDSYTMVAEYQVVARKANGDGYPKTFGSFQRSGAELLEPLSGALRPGSRQKFRLRVPQAEEVALYLGDRPLARLTKKADTFEDSIPLPPDARGKLQVFARFPGQNRYWGMLEYPLR